MMDRRNSRLMLIGLATALLAGCADFGGPISSGAGNVLSPEERRLQEVETKTAQLIRRMDAMNPGQTNQDLTQIRDDLRNLRGELEELRFETQNRERSSKELLVNFDRRLQQIEQGAAAGVGGTGIGTGTVATTTPGTIAPAAAPRATVATPEEERAYLGTFDLLKNGKYDEAIAGFKDMLEQWPQGRYADNGWYWMGEAQLVKRDYSGAASSFKSLAQGFPQSPKMADGLYKLGLAQVELKQNSEARASLQRVIGEFPSSNAANLARQKLQQLGG